MSFFQTRSLSIQVSEPIWGGGAPVEDNLGPQVEQYSHEIAAVGGYASCEFTLNDSQDRVEDWINRIGYHVEVYNESLTKIWEGFVNEIRMNIGSYSVSRGPLLQISNRVLVDYQTVSYATDPPVGGDQAKTAVANDTSSQDKYGILEEAITGGQGTSTEMAQLRDTYLNEAASPETGQELNLGSSSQPNAQISCRGYYDLLDRFYFTQAGTDTQNVSTQIEAVFAAAPTVSYDDNLVGANTLQVPVYTEGETTGMGELQNLVSLGDANDNRFTLGVYNDRAVIYTAVPTTIEYYHAVVDEEQKITGADDGRIYPWSVKAARWLFVQDFLIGSPVASSLRKDPRAVFIESVRYTMPWGLQISGGKVGKFSQKLARLGLGGR